MLHKYHSNKVKLNIFCDFQNSSKMLRTTHRQAYIKQSDSLFTMFGPISRRRLEGWWSKPGITQCNAVRNVGKLYGLVLGQIFHPVKTSVYCTVHTKNFQCRVLITEGAFSFCFFLFSFLFSFHSNSNNLILLL